MREMGHKRNEKSAAADAFSQQAEQEDGRGQIRVVIETTANMTANAGVIKGPVAHLVGNVEMHEHHPQGSKRQAQGM